MGYDKWFRDQQNELQGRPSIKDIDRYHNLRKRLTQLCDDSEGLAKGEDGEQLKALVFTKTIRKILQECS